jgi:hypothetical protein
MIAVETTAEVSQAAGAAPRIAVLIPCHIEAGAIGLMTLAAAAVLLARTRQRSEWPG